MAAISSSVSGSEQAASRSKQNAPGAPNRPDAESSADIFAYICPDFTTAFPREIARGISDGFKEFNANTIYLSTYGSASKEEAAINLAKNLGCKGLVIMPSDEDNYNNAILSLAIDKFPTVLVDRLLFGLNLTCVSSDHYQIGYIAADFLAKKHTAVCMISLNNIVSSIRNRIEGFNHGLAAHRIHHPHHLIFRGNSTLDEITAYFRTLRALSATVDIFSICSYKPCTNWGKN